MIGCVWLYDSLGTGVGFSWLNETLVTHSRHKDDNIATLSERKCSNCWAYWLDLLPAGSGRPDHQLGFGQRSVGQAAIAPYSHQGWLFEACMISFVQLISGPAQLHEFGLYTLVQHQENMMAMYMDIWSGYCTVPSNSSPAPKSKVAMKSFGQGYCTVPSNFQEWIEGKFLIQSIH